MLVTTLFLVAGLLAYLLPWTTAPAASLTLNAYDLAEWSSLHPWLRAGTPPLMLSFVLRGLPAFFVLLIHSTSPQRWRTWTALLLVLVAIALLPPPVFLAAGRDDPNYRQQFVLAVLTLLGLPLSMVVRRWWLQCLLAGLLCIGGLAALLHSQFLMRSFALPATPGLGAVLFVLVVAGYGLYIYKRGLAQSAASSV